MKAKLGMSPIAWWNDDLVELSEDVSLEECLRQWRQDCEQEELLSDIAAGLDEAEHGGGQPVDEAFADIRRQLGWTK